MTLQAEKLTPREALVETYAQRPIDQDGFARFKKELAQLLKNINDNIEAREAFHKKLISDFLTNTHYKDNYHINIPENIDLVIYNAGDSKSPIGVLFEVKSPTNSKEMITTKNLNAKAFQELVYYYLQERITRGNLAVKHLIVTNAKEWFIFDAREFEQLFTENTVLKKQFQAFEDGELSVTKTKNFYEDIAAPFIDKVNDKITFTHFKLEDYKDADEDALIDLYKILSPEHLLKLPFKNDSNTLNKKFYNELLYIIGLTEVSQNGKANGKKLIERCKKGERQSGSLLENAIDGIVAYERQEKIAQYGSNADDRLFNAALELAITWINRILFLKLLESQLLSYHHRDDESYAFLTSSKIKNYATLNDLFFRVLACKYNERHEGVKESFANVPYLNSSLFTPTELEKETLRISELRDDKTIAIFSDTVLKDDSKKKSGKVSLLEYLFAFLDAYDFGSENNKFQSQDKLINASVLGLIFEKINGYKDGSFFTPGFITMYMCRETIRKAVVQKFNEEMNWDCKEFDELYNEIVANRCQRKANEIINSLKICDPAVGSGHFLVSALNEIIALKSELVILQDCNGKLLNVRITVENDELVIQDVNGEPFTYRYPNNGVSQRVQEALFHEKQTIIENCLFGVDINPNSVAICRLRLWIELLKSAYYKNASELETLPNIDINIKCGNSLISRFPLDADLKKVLKGKYTVEKYRNAVNTYRNAKSRDEKQEMERLIAEIKSSFRGDLSSHSKEAVALRKLKGKLIDLTKQKRMFEKSNKERAAWEKEVLQVTSEIEKQEVENDAIKNSKIYTNAFEWRFEFPEVLNDDGSFAGFDVVIGNPPYLFGEQFKRHQQYATSYEVARGQFDSYWLFYECSLTKLVKKSGIHCFINSDAMLARDETTTFRKWLVKNIGSLMLSHVGQVFDGVGVSAVISLVTRGCEQVTKYSVVSYDENTHTFGKTTVVDMTEIAKDPKLRLPCGDTQSNVTWSFLSRQRATFGDYFDISRGEELGKKHLARLSSKTVPPNCVPILAGEGVTKFCQPQPTHFVHKSEIVKSTTNYDSPKIVVVKTGKLFVAAIDNQNLLTLQSVYNLRPKNGMECLLACALLGSRLLNVLLQHRVTGQKKLFPQITQGNILEMPVPATNEKLQSLIIAQVNKILATKKENANADTSTLESEIDKLVYELYGLTDDEIAIVEKL